MTNSEIKQITNFLLINENLLTGGMPTADQLRALKNEKVDFVINLAIENSSNATPNERNILNRIGISYQNIPVIWENPKISDLIQFFSVMDANKSKRLFVHCVLNMRVSVFVYLYNVIQKHIDPEIAILNLRKIWEPDYIWQKFINQAINYFEDKSGFFGTQSISD